MLCAAINVDLGLILRTARIIMGCFFGCFRVKNDARSQPHFISEAVSSKSREAVVSRNRLSALLLAEGIVYSQTHEEMSSRWFSLQTILYQKKVVWLAGSALPGKNNEGSPCLDTTDHTLESPYRDCNSSGLKDEAKFLKSCGTLPETPIELRKASGRVKDLSLRSRESENSKYHSWLPSTSIEKLHMEGKLDRPTISSVKLGEELGKESDSPEHKPISSMEQKLAGTYSARFHESSAVESPNAATNFLVQPDTLSSDTPELPAAISQCKNKSVRFECESNMELLPQAGQSSKQFDSPGHNAAKPSPYPTPLKLTDVMQTPGTVYPVSTENLANRKNARIRSQYVYPVLNPVQNFSQLMALKEEDCYAKMQLGQQRESIEQGEYATPDHTSASHTTKLAMEHEAETIVGKDVNVEASLSNWLKPSSSPTDDKTQNCGSVSSGRSRSDKTPDMDRPIIGLVATHWNDNEPSRISPKWWDGNGIPNSTNKYKEDQKVSWHATPFEERLEKALSNESLVGQRRLTNGPLDLVENEEESDTALSRLQPSKHPESVVSF